MSSVASSEMLDHAGFARGVQGLGPGCRLVLWVRGCSLACPGCMTPELWDRSTPVPLERLAAELAPSLDGMDGITVSGGEPFDQAAGVAALLDRLRADRDLEAVVYTGYLLEKLRERGPEAAALLERTDILVDGPYAAGIANTLQWRGSDNQRVHLLSAHARRHRGTEDAPMPARRPLQVQVLGPATFRLVGIPRRGDMERYREALREKGLILESVDG